jgi:hypothetical protein
MGLKFELYWLVTKSLSLSVKIRLPYNFSGLDIPQEMVVHILIVVEKGHEKLIIPHETTGNVWIRELLDRRCIIVKSKHFRNTYLLLPSFLDRPLLLPKDPEPKLSIIHIGYSKPIPCRILRNFLKFNIAILLATILLRKDFQTRLNIMLDNIRLLFVDFLDRYCTF